MVCEYVVNGVCLECCAYVYGEGGVRECLYPQAASITQEMGWGAQPSLPLVPTGRSCAEQRRAGEGAKLWSVELWSVKTFCKAILG